ncbi:hypothetical protein AX17_006752 [Amanita inopinata Kibby_2008]|nr:hypothetical protein AX17_006752 [Amanita inopinata Kibby_2008]
MIFVGHPEQCVDDIITAYAEQVEEVKEKEKEKEGEEELTPKLATRELKSEDVAKRGMEKVFNHGCVLPKIGRVFAIKDDYGFVLIANER